MSPATTLALLVTLLSNGPKRWQDLADVIDEDLAMLDAVARQFETERHDGVREYRLPRDMTAAQRAAVAERFALVPPTMKEYPRVGEMRSVATQGELFG